MEYFGMTRLNWMRALTLALFASLIGSFPLLARAENEGQADLDKATQQKLGAQSADELTEVIQLCERH